MAGLNALKGLYLKRPMQYNTMCACLSPGGNFVLTPIQHLNYETPFETLDGMKPDISHLQTMGCSAYIFLHEDQCQNLMSAHAELITFIGYTNGVKGWRFMRNTNIIFHATKAVFDENTFLHCPGGSCVSIPAIETGVLSINEQNISLEDNNLPPLDNSRVPPVERDTVWNDAEAHFYFNLTIGNYQPP